MRVELLHINQPLTREQKHWFIYRLLELSIINYKLLIEEIDYMQRFYVPSLKLNQQIAIEKRELPELWHQIKNVMRLEVEDAVSLFNLGSSDHYYKIISMDKNTISLQLMELGSSNTELPFELVLAQALPQKAEKWEWILQKGTELGVTTFIPLTTTRTQRKQLPKDERMEKIIVEAAEQSGRNNVPTITTVQTLSEFAISPAQTFFASLSSTTPLLQQLKPGSNFSRVIIIIGPEGGFTKEEEAALINKGACSYSLGKRTLRLETAAIVSLGQVGTAF